MPRAVHFEVHATDPERMIRFYTDLFGWKFQKLGGPVEYWVITTGPDSAPGINGGLMRRLGAALAALAPAALPPSRPAPQDSLIDRIAWMTGCWAQESPTRLIEEHWMSPRGGSMLGVGRTTRAGALVEYELIVVTERHGQLAYEAHPSGQAVATFLSSRPTDTLVVFENPAHDFPQRVGYRRAGADSLAAWVEGAIGGRNKRIDFTYRRVACDGP